ncbi:carboxypeptidase regulatory-like domain-containing protein [Altererythrobacter salegens]|uniref:Carboxypeptidase regulatory-like domain-containing protein n=1 Tax=Croceibacterium salegens TaxID=1737568 RepID=A0A6I4SZN2_9SPHN|nr:carboxypeptidase-like regulatory domain-containing protein [Croceibacterium salegens]MXO60507.1 carboxypeptidase regulatory-like domain-containing protein [Croceibacterium salegens]
MRHFRTSTRKAFALCAAAFLASGVPSTAQAQSAAATPPTDEDFVLLQLQVKKYNLRNELRGYQTNNGVCVDLADMILALDLPVRLDKKSRRATGWLFREDQTFTIDRDKNAVQIVNTERKLLPGEIYDMPEGWCVDVKSLGGWLGATLTPNLYQSVLKLDSEQPLPFIEAIERKSRAARLRGDKSFDLSAYPQADTPYKTWRAPSVDVVARSGVRSNQGQTQLDLRYELFASGEVAKVSYDARLASDNAGTPDTLRVRAYRKDPKGEMLGPLKATHVAAGDVEMFSGDLAGAAGIGRGAFISNRPLQRPTRFGSTVLRGVLPIGWDAELYRNGQLLAFQSNRDDGRYEFEVNLVYGQNDLEVILYGPQGQVRRETQSIPVGYGAVAPGKLEYWAGVIQRNRDLINFHDPPMRPETGWQYGFGTQYGLDNFTVVGANGQSLVLNGKRRQYAELDLQRTLGKMVLNLSAAQELGRGRAYRAQALGRFGKINVQAQSFFIDGGFTSGLVQEDDKAAHSFQLDTVLGRGRRVFPLSAGFQRTAKSNGQKVNEWLARASLVLPRLALTGILVHRQVYGPQLHDESTSVGLLANTRILGLTVRADGKYRIGGSRKGFESARMTIEKSLDERSDLRLEAEYDARQRVTEFQAGYVRQFDKFSLSTAATADTNGALGANVALNFSFGPDPFGRGLRFSQNKLARRGQAAVTVFLDENGDGIRSPGEGALPDVGVTAGQFGASDPTDKDGRTIVENLSPYEQVLLAVDESTLPDPFLMPVKKGLVLTPRAGVTSEIELPVAPTGEVEGEVRGLEDTPRAGVELELVDQDGDVAATTMTEFDGFFLFERVPYGTYRLRLGASSAKALGTVRDLGRTAILSPDATLVEVGIMRLQASTIASRDDEPSVGGSP